MAMMQTVSNRLKLTMIFLTIIFAFINYNFAFADQSPQSSVFTDEDIRFTPEDRMACHAAALPSMIRIMSIAEAIDKNIMSSAKQIGVDREIRALDCLGIWVVEVGLRPEPPADIVLDGSHLLMVFKSEAPFDMIYSEVLF